MVDCHLTYLGIFWLFVERRFAEVKMTVVLAGQQLQITVEFGGALREGEANITRGVSWNRRPS